MIIDALLVLAGFGAVATGFRRGFLQTLFSTVGYIGGGVLGLGLALHFASEVQSSINRFAAILIAIFLCAEVGRRAFGFLAKFFRTKILWSPLRFIDSVAGAVLELVRVAVIAYLVISVLLWSPWSATRDAVKESSLYPKLSKQAPQIVNQLRNEIEKKLSISPL